MARKLVAHTSEYPIEAQSRPVHSRADDMPKVEDALACAISKRPDMSDVLEQSRAMMVGAVSVWLRNANRGQAEAIRFVKDCFDRDLEALSDLAACRHPEDIFGLDAAVPRSLVSAYMAEGARVFALHSGDGDPLRSPSNLPHGRTAPHVAGSGSDSRTPPQWRTLPWPLQQRHSAPH